MAEDARTEGASLLKERTSVTGASGRQQFGSVEGSA